MHTTLQQPTQATTTKRIDPAVEQIHQALVESNRSELNNTRCRFDGGNVTIFGTVDSYYLKQLAQEIVRRVPIVKTIRNELQVR